MHGDRLDLVEVLGGGVNRKGGGWGRVLNLGGGRFIKKKIKYKNAEVQLHTQPESG